MNFSNMGNAQAFTYINNSLAVSGNIFVLGVKIFVSFQSPFLFLPRHHIWLLKGSNHPPTRWLVRKELRYNINTILTFFPYKVQYTCSIPLLFSVQSCASWAVNEKLTQDQDFSKNKIQSCPSNIFIHWETMAWMNHYTFHRHFCPHMPQSAT